MSNCIFCKIVNGEIPATVVHETQGTMVFEDTNPKAPHHILVVPRKHIINLDKASEEDQSLIGEMMLAVAEVARRQEFAADGYRVVFNVNEDGGQTVDHLHAHMMGGRRMHWPPG